MYSRMKDLIGKKKRNKNVAIKKTNGTIAMDIEDVKAKLNEYAVELFHDDRPDTTEIETDNGDGPLIMREEVRAAIDGMKARKAVGGD